MKERLRITPGSVTSSGSISMSKYQAELNTLMSGRLMAMEVEVWRWSKDDRSDFRHDKLGWSAQVVGRNVVE